MSTDRDLSSDEAQSLRRHRPLGAAQCFVRSLVHYSFPSVTIGYRTDLDRGCVSPEVSPEFDQGTAAL